MAFMGELPTLSEVSANLLSRWDPEVDYVKRVIEKTCKQLLHEGWSEDPAEPHWSKKLTRNNYSVRIALIHGRKGERITGADLAFEVKDQKIVIVQAKRVGSRRRIAFNRFQMQKLLELEAEVCGQTLRGRSASSPISCHPPGSPRLCRVAYYHLVMGTPTQTQERLFHASEVSFVLGNRKSSSQSEFVGQGLSPEDFQRLFWECRIGGPDLDYSIKTDVFHYYSLLTDRLVIWLDVKLA